MRILVSLFFLLGCRGDGGKLTIETENGDIVDSDNDGLSDSEEIAYGTDPNDPDSDGDGIIDGYDEDSNGGESSEGNGPPNGGDSEEGDGPGGGPGNGPGDWDDENEEWGNVKSDDDYLEGNCCYELRMRDEYSDGWNGAYLTVKVGEAELIYAMEFGDNRRRVDICADEGLDIDFVYTTGNYDQENRYAIVDPFGDTVVEEGPNPDEGLIYSAQGICLDESEDDEPSSEEESEDDTEDEDEDEDENVDDGLWDWGEPESSDTFDTTYDVILYVANSSTGYVICEEEVSITIQNETISDSISCTT
ncbi:MAG: hypothetical protein VX278_15665, partial [Myxococcota bacterium]|nr:hypothetical protein [Myxococcota bacterium]